MRNTPLLCAAALSLALSLPASAAPSLAFNRPDWQVVEISFPNAGINAAVKTSCAGGTLAARKVDVYKGEHSGWTFAGYNTKIDLYCVSFAGGQATVAPVPANVLYMDVYGPFGMDKSLRVWAGRSNSDVVVRDPAGTELTGATPAPPATGGETVPIPKPKPTPKPKPARPSKKPPVNGGPNLATAPLSALETGWLTPVERSNYEDATGKTPAPSASDLAQAAKKARAFVATNLRPEAQKGYQALVDAGTFDKIDAYLTPIKFYSGAEVQLSKDEHDALATVLKTAGHSDFAYPNAMLQYDFEMRSIMDPATHVPLVSAHVLAHQITLKYRAMVPAKPGTGGQTPGTAPVMLTRDQLKNLSDADWAAYQDAWGKAKDDDARAALNKTYLAKNAAAANSSAGGGSTTPFDPSTIKTLDDLKRHTPAEQKQFCSALSSNAGAAGNCGDILNNADAATSKCNALTGADQTATLKARNDCMAKINACKPQAGGAATSAIPSASLPKDLRDYCATLLANDSPQTPGQKIGTGGSSAIDNNPCGGSSAKGGTDGSTGAAQPGKDVDPCPKKADKGPDPNFTTNLGNGMAFGIGGLLLASFLGGPLLMLAVGVAAGVGGYFASKWITEPPTPGKGS